MKNRILSLLFLISAALSVSAQHITGVVANSSNTPIANHEVYIFCDTVNFPLSYVDTTLTNSLGEYQFTLPANMASNPSVVVTVKTYDSCYFLQVKGGTYTGTPLTYNFNHTCPYFMDTMKGTVYSSSTPDPDAVVYAIKKYYDPNIQAYTLTAIDSAYTDAQGKYNLKIPSGGYLIKAAPRTSNPNYANLLPTYASYSLTWNNAAIIQLYGGNTVNLVLMPGVNLGGPGFIGGSVLQGANKTAGPGDPLASRILILTDMADQPVAYTYSDANGAFSFSNVALGDYKIFGDAPGKLNPALNVSLTSANPSVTNITFTENSTVFQGNLELSVGQLQTQSIVLGPNPTSDVFTINELHLMPDLKSIRVIDMMGRVVFEQNLNGENAISISTANWPSGVYSVQLHTGNGTESVKLLKQ